MDQRREFAIKSLGTLNFRALCQEHGISTKTGYKWRERLLRQGLEGMREESRRPRSSPQQLRESQVCEMVKLKLAHQHWGPRSCGERSLTASALMKHWECVARQSSIATRPGVTMGLKSN
jgi:transposase